MKIEFQASQIDVKSLAHSSGVVGGPTALANFDRLMQETQGLGGQRLVPWTARGELQADASGAAQIWLHLNADMSLPLVCQRCLGAVDVAVSIDRSFRFVETEAQAELEDEASEEDVLALSADFSLVDLLEDEVLMALPAVPRHDECPVSVTLEIKDVGFEDALVQKENPFAVLATMRQGVTD